MEKRYLGVFLGNDFSIQKDWEGMADKVIGRLKKMEMVASSAVFQRTHTNYYQSCGLRVFCFWPKKEAAKV